MSAIATFTQLEFDYGDLDKPAVRSLEARAKAITATQEKVRKTTAEGVLKIGEELKAAHDLLAGKGRDGAFGPWVKMRCGFSVSTAEKSIAAYKAFGADKSVNFTHFFDASALYLLSADSCPEEATEEAIKLAESGERVTHKIAKALKKKHDPPEEDETEGEDEGEEEDSLSWDITECVSSMRREVFRWSRVCPKSQIKLLAELLEDLKRIVEKKDGD